MAKTTGGLLKKTTLFPLKVIQRSFEITLFAFLAVIITLIIMPDTRPPTTPNLGNDTSARNNPITSLPFQKHKSTAKI